MYFQYGETEINYLKRKDKRLASVIDAIGHIERKLDDNLFAAVVRHIVGQQISSKAQATVWARLETRLKDVTPFAVHAASAQELQGLGMSLRKAEYIKDFADKIVSVVSGGCLKNVNNECKDYRKFYHEIYRV